MNSLKKFAPLYDKIDYYPKIKEPQEQRRALMLSAVMI